MAFEDLFYTIGAAFEGAIKKIAALIKEAIKPQRSDRPPQFKFLRKVVRRDITVHELLSLKLQIILIVYLLLSLAIVLILKNPLCLVALFVVEMGYMRYIINRNWDFFVDPEPYRFFYYLISIISLLSFSGYLLLRRLSPSIYYYYAYLLIVLVTVLVFRGYFRHKYGRDYTYGVVEEVKNDLIRVFVNDDLAANVKPGKYWVPAVPDAEPGRVVKLLVEERTLKGAVPVRVLEVYLGDQSSHTSTEPKEEAE